MSILLVPCLSGSLNNRQWVEYLLSGPEPFTPWSKIDDEILDLSLKWTNSMMA